jgi:SNF2 family DNA or RNA helicase
MIPPLYAHQKTTIAEDKKKCGLFTGTGSAKTRTALEMAEGRILVICPKQQREDMTWQKNATKFGLVKNLKVVSKEEFRRDYHIYPHFDTVIIDECHNNFGIAPEMRQRKGIQIPRASQIFEATYAYLKKCPPKRLYLCSATPVPKPMAMWGIATILGQTWDFYKFREKYYFPIKVGFRQVWIPRKDEASKQALADLVKTFGYTGSLNDFFDVPEQTHKEVHIDLTEPQKKAMKDLSHNEADPLVRRARERTIENGVLYGKSAVKINALEEQLVDRTILYPSGKIDYIVERAIEFPKLLIFAYYKAQINAIADKLKEEGYKVMTLTGETKDRSFMEKVDQSNEPCIIIAQSNISEGYQLPSFPCVIYASKSWRWVYYEQSLGRVLRSDNLKKNLYIHLIVKGGPDEDCHKAVMSGMDFQEKLSLS